MRFVHFIKLPEHILLTHDRTRMQNVQEIHYWTRRKNKLYKNKRLTPVLHCWIKRRAWISWPWPIEMARHSILCRLANPSMALVGSDPMESKPIIGVLMSLSSHVASKLRMTPSAKRSPIDSAMYRRACDRVRSGHHDLHNVLNW